MNSQKADNQLNLALDLPKDVRSDTLDLDVGYNEIDNKWELIIKYIGNLDRVTKELDVSPTLLFSQYAILRVKQEDISKLEKYEEIIYIEKPKQLEYEVADGKAVSCLVGPQSAPYNLDGKGVLVAIIDSGIDYAHPDFRNADGTTRILRLWDQTIPGNPPKGYQAGTLYTKEQIDEAIKEPTLQRRYEKVPSTDLSGHGTHVAGIACGNGRASNGKYKGVAFDSDMIVVKLGTSEKDSFPRTSQLMTALNYVVGEAIRVQKPLAINVSFGNSYGSHAGNSLLERFINDISIIWKINIVVGTGNEGSNNRHYHGVINPSKNMIVEMDVSEKQPSFNVQMWKIPTDISDVKLITPGGQMIGPINRTLGSQTLRANKQTIYVYYGQATPYSIFQEIYFEFVPDKTLTNYVEAGIWKFIIEPKYIVDGDIHLWLPSANAINENTKFAKPSVETTLTIPSTADYAISVGAYDGRTDNLAFFSGRGYTFGNRVKPDLVAPGVDVTSTAPNGGYTTKSGTSQATPFVTGAVAMLMQWGIVEGNDPYLYGEKVKAYLITNARKLEIYKIYPNETLGFGALCLENKFGFTK